MKRKWLVSIAGVFLLAAARGSTAPAPSPNSSSTQSVRDLLMRTDSEFSHMSEAKGPLQAFEAYVAPDGILLAAYPGARGRAAVRSQFFAAPPGMRLTWRPALADVASSGDLGYTVGTYELKSSAAADAGAARTGKYVTIWKKQADGSWKFVVDAGNPDAPPAAPVTPLAPLAPLTPLTTATPRP